MMTSIAICQSKANIILTLLSGLMISVVTCSSAAADSADDARNKAAACSTAVITRDALSSQERTAALARRAYYSCIDAWAAAAHQLSDRMAADPAVKVLKQSEQTLNGSTPTGTYLGLRSADLKLRADFIRKAKSQIRAIRAEKVMSDDIKR